ncbi:unnamed protein product, partial [Rotaria sp. Silwood2]
MAEACVTLAGKSLLVVDDYTFKLNKATTTTKYWICTINGCAAKVHTDSNNRLMKTVGNHNHLREKEQLELKYLTHVAKADLVKLEKQYKSDGCDISLNRLRRHSEFIAPPDMHSKIEDSLEALTKIREISFEIDEPGFEVLVSQELERLLAIVKLKCFLEKTIETRNIHIPIPKAWIASLDNEVKQAQSATTTATALPNKTSVNIGHSTVTILTGDLTTQA